ncbi:hypothetical protein V5O48_016154 [Marasmius crinis-equi]|uniref:J domain-containing protein n=1 Tax=Marasmius crinis-equi TaxID=585013 RepID=A0ABR3ESU7_9AGAR
MPATISVSAAYATLGVEKGSSLEVVKSAYRQLALRTHPDKNPDDPNATKQFQQVGEAYNVLSKHLDTSNRSGGGYYCSQGHYHEYDSDFDDYDDEYYSDEYDSEMEAEAAEYYRYEFREPRMPKETQAHFDERVRRNHEEQVQAEQRRKREAQIRKERAEEDRERERTEKEKRQKAKSQKKKASAQADREKAEAAARSQREKTQTLRSSVFNAARSGNSKKVKDGIWESNVDAAGGEVKPGYEEFVKAPRKDPRETLMHIVAKRGDLELLEWLDSHNADPEERDSQNLTAFHVAVRHGQLPIMNYFLENHPPGDDSREVYRSPLSSSLSNLRLAIESGDPQVVKLVLEQGLASSQVLNEVWTWMTSKGVETLPDEIAKIIMQHGGFTPPPTPVTNRNGDGSSAGNKKRGRGRGRGHNRQRDESRGSRSPDAGSERRGSPIPQGPPPQSASDRGNGRGRGRGRGRGQGRGRGRGGGDHGSSKP